MSDGFEIERLKKERSPSFPFISLERAVERASALWDRHRREPARLLTIAPTWGYAPKSSGLLQTVAALKQYGLIEDSGSGEDRKIQLSDLGRRIISDQRPGAKEAALREAALKPRLFAEYSRWIGDPPSEAHCLSELELDRGFTPDAAKTFYRSFFGTVAFANLEPEERSVGSNVAVEPSPIQSGSSVFAPTIELHRRLEPHRPFSERFKVEMTTDALSVSAVLKSANEVDRLIRILEANKLMLSETEGG